MPQVKEHKFPVMEVFGPTIQGEGIMSGTVTHFLRTGGCGLRCSWCDSLFAVLPKEIKKHRTMMTSAEILNAVRALPSAPYITFTGGDPCLHRDLGEIIPTLNIAGMNVAIETQGQLFPEWLKECDVLTFSPKGPSSGNIVDVLPLAQYLVDEIGYKRHQRVCIKVVVFDEADFEYAMHVYKTIPEAYYDAFYFTAGTPLQDVVSEETAAVRAGEVLTNFRALSELVLKQSGINQYNQKVHVGCQQHVLLWAEKDQGV